ncbi:acetyltransferase [soil metagenome]
MTRVTPRPVARLLADTVPRVRASLTRQPPPSLRCKIKRGIWGLAWMFLFRPSPRILPGWRRFLLRCFGAKIGRGALPYPGMIVWAPWNLVMGDRSVIGDGVDCYSVATITLADDASVSQRAYLCTASRDIDDPGHHLMTGPITIGPRGWVAAEAYVGPGVTVGEGAVVAARGVAVRDVPAWTVVGGNPAKPLRKRRED